VLRFLLSRRWLGLLLVVIVVGVTCVELGRWQFHRYHSRHDANIVTRANLVADPAPVDDVMSTSRPPADDDEWRVVEATGTYDVDHQVVVLYRTRNSAPGVDVVTPLVTDAGPALLIDRGWVATAGNANLTPDVPAPPDGTVTVTAWVRINAEGGNATELSDGSVRSISSEAIGPSLPYDVYDGFADLTGEHPSAKPSPQLADPPDLSGGPHFFYGVQWFFFAGLAFAFWIYFGYAEYQQQVRVRDHPGPKRDPARSEGFGPPTF
jgi:cytochrome oxidase assembly protein ShyY1